MFFNFCCVSVLREPSNQKNPHVCIVFPVSLLCILPPPPQKRLSCPVAQHACLTWYFTGWAPVRVRACVWGTVFGWVSFSSSGTVLLSIIPSAEGSASDSSLAHIWLSGAPDSSDHRPNLSPLECEFSDLRLQIVHLQQCQSRNTISFGNIFSSTAEAECSLTEPCVPRYFSISLKVG